MALSGSFSGGIRSNKYKLRVDWSATQSIADNTSTITCTMYLVQASGFDLYISGRSNTTTINGEAKTWSSPAISGAAGKTTKLGSVKSSAITHNADGTKSITIKAVFNVRATISGTYYETITAESTITLDTIPRATTPTLNKSSVDMGGTVNISLPRASSNFTHDLAYSFAGSGYTNIATGQATSYTWTVPDLASKIPNTASGVVTIRCITKNGSTVLGTTYVTLAAKVPLTAVPTISSVTVTPVNTGVLAGKAVYVRGFTQARVSISASGAKGSTITDYSTSLDSRTYSESSFTSALLNTPGTRTLTVRVRDSRGRWSVYKNVNITVVDYEPPKITGFSFFRFKYNDNGVAVEAPDSTDVAISFTGSISNLSPSGGTDTLNQATLGLYRKPSTATEWETIEETTSYYDTSFIRDNYPLFDFSLDVQYDLRLRLTDITGRFAEYTVIIPTAEVILDIKADGTAMAFGKVAEQSDVYEFGKDVMFSGPVYGNVAGIGEIPQLPNNTDFNSCIEIGCWSVRGNAAAETMANMPIQKAGRLYVEAATGEGIRATGWSYLKQKFVPYRTEFPTYERDVSRDTSNVWTFGEWVATTIRGHNLLWRGMSYMNGDQVASLNEAVSEQSNGIVLVFSRYDDTTGVADNSNFNSFFVHKKLVELWPGGGHCFSMNTVNYSFICSKYLYISDTRITGNGLNSVTDGNVNGIKYNNASYVLRYVIGV